MRRFWTGAIELMIDQRHRKTLLIQFGLIMAVLLATVASLGWFFRQPRSNALLADAVDALHRGEYDEAERRLQETVERDPANLEAHCHLATMLSLQGRRWESLPHYIALLRGEQQTTQELLLVGNLEMTPEPADEAAKGDSIAFKIAKAKLLGAGKAEQAQQLFREVVAERPDLVEAQAQLGLLLAATGESEEFLAWDRRFEPRPHPDLWTAKGMFAQRREEIKVAARCFGEAVRLNPNHRVSLQQLARVMAALKEDKIASSLLERNEKLVQLLEVLNRIYQQRDVAASTRRAAELTESLGRLLEARAWRRELLQLEPDDKSSREALVRIEKSLSNSDDPDLPDARTLLDSQLFAGFEKEYYPMPKWHKKPPVEPPPPAPKEKKVSQIQFRDVAAQRGVRFRYYAGVAPDRRGGEGKFMFELTGGGVGTIDVDLDGWPDLLFTQGAEWPPQADEPRRDELFWNHGEEFEEIAAVAGLDGRGFGQGVAVGDFDNDGFPDLYVANIGRNQLLQNNGDGTFTPVTMQAGLTDAVWTSSCLVADLNGDGMPDLYDVNYLRGEELFSKRCTWDDGVVRICGPIDFEAEQDQIFLSQGDGRFERATKDAGIERAGGNGLGVVAMDLDASGATDLFVANDQTANFLFMNQAARRQPPRFEERAGLAGVAVDYEGNPQGSMGVAVDDIDGDGRLDLFVTNFSQEWYTLYHQIETGVFTDESAFAGLRGPTFDVLGFGTQFLDADLDGWPDLVAANGHIDDFRHRDWLYKMPPHFYRNRGDGRFARVEAATLGAYFQTERLGRGLAKLDFDRDGREDFAVSHLESDAALVRNETDPVGRYIAVRLIGLRCDRDAITATVTATSKDWSRRKQLTAGDGYLASNERRIVFGLGDRERLERLHIRWPDGSEQTLEHPPLDRELTVLQE